MAQIIRITSEALQATIRRLLPSQQGFGEDLQASNIIQPIIDLTPSAEGSELPSFLAQAASLDRVTTFNVAGSNTTPVSTPGFYRIYGVSDTAPTGASDLNANISISDGITTKKVWEHRSKFSTVGQTSVVATVDLVLFVQAGESVTVTSTDGLAVFAGAIYQIADVNGNVTNPPGFTFQ